MHRISKLHAFAGALAIATLASTPAAADLAKWDQAKVTAIAQDMAKAAEAWWMATRDQPADPAEANPEGSIVNKARVLQEMSASLASHLKEGQDHDKTLDEYKSIKEVHDDTIVKMQETMLDQPTQQVWNKFADAYKQISAFYDPNAGRGEFE